MIKRLLFATVLCFAFGTTYLSTNEVFAQTVIRERIILPTEGKPIPGDSTAKAQGTTALASVTPFIAPASGELRLRYIRATRKENYYGPGYSNTDPPTLEGHTLQIDYSINGSASSILDEIQPPPVAAKSASTTEIGPRFEWLSKWLNCRFPWHGPVCAWDYSWAQAYTSRPFFDYRSLGTEVREEAIPMVALGTVETDDEIDLLLTYREADGDVHLLDLTPVAVSSLEQGVAWAVQGRYFGGYYPYLGGVEEDLVVLVELLAPEITFLRQNDEEIPREGTDAHLMVSKFRTDEMLDSQTPFESPYAGRQAFDDQYTPFPDVVDKYTFRPQVTGIETGKTVEFRLEIVRGGSVVSGLTQTYEAMEDVLDNAPAYRANKQVRLVSNEKPADAPFGATYDDEVRDGSPDQTIRAELEDLVRITLIVDGETTTTKAELPVGLPASEDHPVAARRVEMNWQWLETLPGVNPVLTTQRMSEDWAQAAIYFKIKEDAGGTQSATSFNRNAVGNILYVSFKKTGFLDLGGRPKETPEAGSVSVEIDGQPAPIMLNYEADQTIQEVVASFTADLEQALGTEVLSHPAETENEKKGRLKDTGEAELFYIVMGKGKNVFISSAVRDNVVYIKQQKFNMGSLELHDLAALARSLRDDDPLTIDAFVIPDNAMHPKTISSSTYTTKVLGKGFSNNPTYYAMPHTLFIYPQSSDPRDDFPLVAGHEVGHVLLGPGHAEDFYDNSLPFRQHLMYGNTAEREELSGPKRLSLQHQVSARGSSLMQAKSRYQQ